MSQRNAIIGALALVSVGPLFLLFPATPAHAGQVLKILQLNFNDEIVAFDDRDGHIRDRRFAAIVDFIRKESPDVVFIEEGWNYKGYVSLAAPLAEAVGYDSFYRVGMGFPLLLWDSDVVLAKKEFRMREKRKVQLPHSAWHIGDEIHWVIPFGAITNAVGARLTLADGQTLIVYTTHLIGSTDSDLADQAKAYDAEVQQHAVGYDHIPWSQAKVIMAGDMNSDANTAQMTYLRNAGYTDTWYAAHPDHFDDNAAATNCGDPYSPRFNPFTIGANEFPVQNTWSSDQRIDYIYTHGPGMRTLASTQVFTRPQNGVWMSDHYGLLSTIAIDDDDAPPVANPLTDSDGLPPLPADQVVKVDDGVFAPCAHKIDCDIDLGELEVDAMSGISFVNSSWDHLGVQVDGEGTVVPESSVGLDRTQMAAFSFETPGRYKLVVHDSVGDTARVVLRVSL